MHPNVESDVSENNALPDWVAAFASPLGSNGLYISPTLQQRLDLIEHLIEFGRQIVILNGGAGSGKSAIVGHFSADKRLNWYSIRIQAGPTLTAQGITNLVAHELDVATDPRTEPDLDNRLKTRIVALERAGKIPVLLIDDADQLLPEAISAVVHLAYTPDQQAELRVLMAADLDRSAVREALQREHPQHGLVHVVEIPRLTETQVRALISHRLEEYEVDPEDYFDDVDYATMAREADGICGKVITLARQHLSRRESISIPPQMPSRPLRQAQRSRLPRSIAFGIAAAVALALGAWWATYNPPSAPAPSVEAVELPTSDYAQATPKIEVDKPPDSAISPLLPSPAPSAPTQSPSAGFEAILPPGVSVDPGSVPATTPTVEGPAMPVRAPNVETSLSATKTLSPPIPDNIANPTVPPKPQPRLKSAPANAIAPPISAYSVAWLLRQPASGHTLQLFGVRDRGAAETFIRERGIGQQAAILPTMLNGQPWYVVTYSYFPTRAAAVAALAKLPPALRNTQPWARSIGSLQSLKQ